MDAGLNLPDFLVGLWQSCLKQANRAGHLIQKNITSNRSLSSKKRRAFQEWLIKGLRWPMVYQAHLDKKDLTSFQLAVANHELMLSEMSWTDVSPQKLAELFNVPLFWVDSLQSMYANDALAPILLSLHKQADVHLRINAWVHEVEKTCKAIEQDGLQLHPIQSLPYGFALKENHQLGQYAWMKKGWVDVQNAASQHVVHHMKLAPKQNIVDGCARTGGKSLAMLNYTQGGSTIHAMDVDARALETLKKRVMRNHAKGIDPKWLAPDEKEPFPTLEQKADHLLVDAPCSGMGTLRRRPWLKHALEKESLIEHTQVQFDILCKQARWVKPGGYLTYAVCSLFPQEGQEVVDRFLEQDHFFECVETKRLTPLDFGSDGFFWARMVKAAK